MHCENCYLYAQLYKNEPVSKHIYIYKCGDKPVFYEYVYKNIARYKCKDI